MCLIFYLANGKSDIYFKAIEQNRGSIYMCTYTYSGFYLKRVQCFINRVILTQNRNIIIYVMVPQSFFRAAYIFSFNRNLVFVLISFPIMIILCVYRYICVHICGSNIYAYTYMIH